MPRDDYIAVSHPQDFNVRQKCPKCGGKVRSNGHCRRCDDPPSHQRRELTGNPPDSSASAPAADLDTDLNQAIREWDALGKATTDPEEAACCKLAKVVAMLLTDQASFNKHGSQWLTDVVNPTLARAASDGGLNHPLILRVTAFRDRAARRLERAAGTPQSEITRPPASAAAADPIPPQSSLPKIQGQVRKIIAKYSRVATHNLQAKFPLNQIFSGHWMKHRDELIEQMENTLQIHMPLDVEESLETLGDLERFFAVARDFEASANRSTGSFSAVEAELCDDIRDDETWWEFYTPWRRIVRMNVDARAWSSWVGTKRIRAQLCTLLPGWRISISKYSRNGEVAIDLTSPRYNQHHIEIDRHGQMADPQDLDLSVDLSRIGIDGKNEQMVCFRIRNLYRGSVGAETKRGLLSWLRSAKEDEARKQEYIEYLSYGNERIEVQRAVAQLDVVAAYGRPICEYTPRSS